MVHAERRRCSSRRIGFWVEAEQGAESLGEDGEGDMAMPAGEGSSLEVVEAEPGFEFSVVVFDAPADLGQLYQFSSLGCAGSCSTAST